tara:strand:+ start:296 stop:514 length:219 start_codon:yes stop_codon:yes gene_type:complete
MSEDQISLYREEDESWYEAGLRYTEQSNLSGAFEDYYFDEIRNGEDDFASCMIALEKCGFNIISEEIRDEDA